MLASLLDSLLLILLLCVQTLLDKFHRTVEILSIRKILLQRWLDICPDNRPICQLAHWLIMINLHIDPHFETNYLDIFQSSMFHIHVTWIQVQMLDVGVCLNARFV